MSHDLVKLFHFEVRHLFRHLGEGSALRRNALVRARFERETKGETDSELVAEVTAHVKVEAAACRSRDIAAGCKDTAERLYAIICAIIAKEAPVRTASSLNLSRRQYYRDRRAICTRIARTFIRTTDGSAVIFVSAIPCPVDGVCESAIIGAT